MLFALADINVIFEVAFAIFLNLKIYKLSRLVPSLSYNPNSSI